MPRYEPETYSGGANPKSLAEYLQRELRRIAVTLDGVEEILLTELHVEPDKPRNGQVILVDGTDFNPGSGRGFYGRSNGAWVFSGPL